MVYKVQQSTGQSASHTYYHPMSLAVTVSAWSPGMAHASFSWICHQELKSRCQAPANNASTHTHTNAQTSNIIKRILKVFRMTYLNQVGQSIHFA